MGDNQGTGLVDRGSRRSSPVLTRARPFVSRGKEGDRWTRQGLLGKRPTSRAVEPVQSNWPERLRYRLVLNAYHMGPSALLVFAHLIPLLSVVGGKRAADMNVAIVRIDNDIVGVRDRIG